MVSLDTFLLYPSPRSTFPPMPPIPLTGGGGAGCGLGGGGSLGSSGTVMGPTSLSSARVFSSAPLPASTRAS